MAAGKAFTLNKRTGKQRKSDHLQRWEAHGAITVKDLVSIMESSTDPEAAAVRVEAIATGKADPNPKRPVVDAAEVEAMVASRVAEAVAGALAALGVDKEGLELLHAAKAAKAVPKKRGRPRKIQQEVAHESA